MRINRASSVANGLDNSLRFKRRRASVLLLAAVLAVTAFFVSKKSSELSSLESWVPFLDAQRCADSLAKDFFVSEPEAGPRGDAPLLVLVGHAYGDGSAESGALDQRLVSFLSQLPLTRSHVVFAGDVVERASDAAFERLGDELSALEGPRYLAPGNHDEFGDWRERWAHAGFAGPGRYDLGQLVLFVLDTTDLDDSKRILSAAPPPHKPALVVTHHVLARLDENAQLAGNVSDYGAPQQMDGAEEWLSGFAKTAGDHPILWVAGDAPIGAGFQCVRRSPQLLMMVSGVHRDERDTVLVIDGEYRLIYPCFLADDWTSCHRTRPVSD